MKKRNGKTKGLRRQNQKRGQKEGLRGAASKRGHIGNSVSTVERRSLPGTVSLMYEWETMRTGKMSNCTLNSQAN